MSGAVRAVPRGGGLGLRIALVLVVALLAGGLTPLGQQYLPDAIRSAANSAVCFTKLGSFFLPRFGTGAR